jgi:hypothetical protein
MPHLTADFRASSRPGASRCRTTSGHSSVSGTSSEKKSAKSFPKSLASLTSSRLETERFPASIWAMAVRCSAREWAT